MENHLDVRFHAFEADVECGCDFLVGEASRDGLDNLVLALRELWNRRVVSEYPLDFSGDEPPSLLGVLVLAYNLLRYVIARGQAPGKRRGIASTAAAAMSFISTIPILCVARRSLAKAFTRLVAAVAADTLERRTRKNYVRAVKRRPKPYPLLTKPRSEYRPEEII